MNLLNLSGVHEGWVWLRENTDNQLERLSYERFRALDSGKGEAGTAATREEVLLVSCQAGG